MKNTDHITLVLGSGGARGLAHIGVIKYLEEKRVPIHAVVGSSIGAIIGGAYASGMRAAEMEKIVESVDKLRMAKILWPGFSVSGIINNDRVRKFIRELVGDKRVEKLPCIFRAVATDLITGEEVVIEKGSLADAIIASSAVPAVFQPVYYQSHYLIDGGLSNPLPISVARRLSPQPVIAVNVAPNPERIRKIIQEKMKEKDSRRSPSLPAWLVTLLQSSGYTLPEKNRVKPSKPLTRPSDIYLPSALRVSLQSVLISANNLITLHMKQARPDVLIAPKIESYDMFDFHKGTEVIQCGYDAAKAIGLEDTINSTIQTHILQ
ncbi:MAG TPA: patatin-like phospholipase family protein [Bacteroidota bacterium]|nr:patatin-like phospholipase family protein [Bacteroidota bacterium]